MPTQQPCRISLLPCSLPRFRHWPPLSLLLHCTTCAVYVASIPVALAFTSNNGGAARQTCQARRLIANRHAQSGTCHGGQRTGRPRHTVCPGGGGPRQREVGLFVVHGRRFAVRKTSDTAPLSPCAGWLPALSRPNRTVDSEAVHLGGRGECIAVTQPRRVPSSKNTDQPRWFILPPWSEACSRT